MLVAAIAAPWLAQALDQELVRRVRHRPVVAVRERLEPDGQPARWPASSTMSSAPIVIAGVVLVVAALLNRWLRRLVTAFIVQFTRE